MADNLIVCAYMYCRELLPITLFGKHNPQWSGFAMIEFISAQQRFGPG